MFYFLYYVLYRKACRSRGIKVAAPPLDSPCDRPVTYQGDSKTLVKSSKGRSGPTLNSNNIYDREGSGRLRLPDSVTSALEGGTGRLYPQEYPGTHF
jgi:hypothetical protein